MKYLDKSFSSPANSRAYVDNWNAVFGDDSPPCDEPAAIRSDRESNRDRVRRWERKNPAQTLRLNIAKQERQKARLAELKTGPCVDCRLTYDPVCMDFDHLPGSAKVGCVTTLAHSTNWDAVLDEIKKCDLVCSNCHRLRSRRRTLERRALRIADATRK